MFTLYLPEHHVPPSADEVAAVVDDWVPRTPSFANIVGTPTALAEPDPIVSRPIDDDRANIHEGDRVLLIIEDDVTFARIMLQMAREKGFKVIVATRGDTGLSLANKYQPDAITLDIKLPGLDGWTLLDRLKRSPTHASHPGARHLRRRDEPPRRRAGRVRVPREAGQPRSARGRLQAHHDLPRSAGAAAAAGRGRRPAARRRSSSWSATGEDVEVTAVRTAEEAFDALDDGDFDCMVVDLILPGDDGIRLLEKVRATGRLRELPVDRLHRQGSDAGGRRRAEEVRRSRSS